MGDIQDLSQFYLPTTSQSKPSEMSILSNPLRSPILIKSKSIEEPKQ